MEQRSDHPNIRVISYSAATEEEEARFWEAVEEQEEIDRLMDLTAKEG